MKKGFTLVEVMATIVILAVILLIAVPIYNGVRERINESIYKSKIEEILSKAESFASENNAFVFDVKTLIEQGLISADNETGIFMDPRTNRDMKCDILNAIYKENHYEVSITESDVCYDLEELENLYGMVELKLYDEAGSEIEKLENTDWLRNQEIHVRYEFKEEYQEYANSIESLLWTGEQVVSCSKEDLSTCQEYIVNTEEIKNVVVGLEVRVNMNGASMVNTVRKNILVDLQRPSVIDGSIVINNEISTNNERRVEYEISDGSGSGVRYTSIVKEKTCNGQEYEENKQSASDGIQSIYLGNGDYYICVEDQVGNRTRDEDLENPNNQIHVEGVDQSIPVISKFEVKSTTSSYNALTTNLSIEASDDSGSNGLQMCISNTGYLQGCSWEKYSSSKSWKVSGSLDGGVRTIYLSIQDRAGNIVNREAKYTVYKDCSNQTKVYTDANYGACSKKCGGGLQYRAYQMKDTKTGTVCTTAKDSKTCNTHSCDPVETMDPNNYESSKKVACDANNFKRLLSSYISKFQSALNYQPFRNALYDCASVTQSALRSSNSAYNILRNHSRTRIVTGRGDSESCTCYPQKDSSSAERTCRKPACSEEHQRFVSGTVYNGRVLVLSATTKKHLSSTYDGDGFGDYEDEGSSWEKDGYTAFLIGSGNDIREESGWGECTKTDNAVINWDDCDSSDERKNRISKFLPSLRVGLYRVVEQYYDSSPNSDRVKHYYYSDTVYVQIFVI